MSLFIVNPQDTSSLLSCIPFPISWQNGVSPFTVRIVVEEDDAEEIHNNLTGTDFTWSVDVPVGQHVNIFLSDSDQPTQQSFMVGPYEIQASGNTMCLDQAGGPSTMPPTQPPSAVSRPPQVETTTITTTSTTTSTRTPSPTSLVVSFTPVSIPIISNSSPSVMSSALPIPSISSVSTPTGEISSSQTEPMSTAISSIGQSSSVILSPSTSVVSTSSIMQNTAAPISSMKSISAKAASPSHPLPTHNSTANSGTRTHTRAIAGGIVGGLAGLFLLLALYILRKRRARTKQTVDPFSSRAPRPTSTTSTVIAIRGPVDKIRRSMHSLAASLGRRRDFEGGVRLPDAPSLAEGMSVSMSASVATAMAPNAEASTHALLDYKPPLPLASPTLDSNSEMAEPPTSRFREAGPSSPSPSSSTDLPSHSRRSSGPPPSFHTFASAPGTSSPSWPDVDDWPVPPVPTHLLSTFPREQDGGVSLAGGPLGSGTNTGVGVERIEDTSHSADTPVRARSAQVLPPEYGSFI